MGQNDDCITFKITPVLYIGYLISAFTLELLKPNLLFLSIKKVGDSNKKAIRLRYKEQLLRVRIINYINLLSR